MGGGELKENGGRGEVRKSQRDRQPRGSRGDVRKVTVVDLAGSRSGDGHRRGGSVLKRLLMVFLW